MHGNITHRGVYAAQNSTQIRIRIIGKSGRTKSRNGALTDLWEHSDGSQATAQGAHVGPQGCDSVIATTYATRKQMIVTTLQKRGIKL